MNRSRSPFIRHYQAPTRLATGQAGTWYAEYDGIWTVREFVVDVDHRAAVAPFDLRLREEPGHPTEPPALVGIAWITLQDFEGVWEQFAQPRLHVLAAAHTKPAERAADIAVCYFRQPFPAELKRDEVASALYYEYAQGIARRSFEVFLDHTLVAPYDAVIPENGTNDMLRAAREGLGFEDEPIDSRLCPEEISHAVFEAYWEQHALVRLRELAELPSGTRNS